MGFADTLGDVWDWTKDNAGTLAGVGAFGLLAYANADQQSAIAKDLQQGSTASYEAFVESLQIPEDVKKAQIAQAQYQVSREAPESRREISNRLASRGIRGKGLASPLAEEEEDILMNYLYPYINVTAQPPVAAPYPQPVSPTPSTGQMFASDVGGVGQNVFGSMLGKSLLGAGAGALGKKLLGKGAEEVMTEKAMEHLKPITPEGKFPEAPGTTGPVPEAAPSAPPSPTPSTGRLPHGAHDYDFTTGQIIDHPQGSASFMNTGGPSSIWEPGAEGAGLAPGTVTPAYSTLGATGTTMAPEFAATGIGAGAPVLSGAYTSPGALSFMNTGGPSSTWAPGAGAGEAGAGAGAFGTSLGPAASTAAFFAPFALGAGILASQAAKRKHSYSNLKNELDVLSDPTIAAKMGITPEMLSDIPGIIAQHEGTTIPMDLSGHPAEGALYKMRAISAATGDPASYIKNATPQQLTMQGIYTKQFPTAGW